MRFPRSSGILLHPTSLPGGTLGPQAYTFVDWLAAAGQSWWMLLPLTPPDRSGSPYRSRSAFAGWPGLLAEPRAPVSDRERRRFAARHGYWVDDWTRFAGAGALDDQVRFEREWRALRAYAARRGVRLIGDVPMYVDAESADAAAHPELFERGEVAGAPPDALGPRGQLWGNPLYDWRAMRAQGYRWWVERFRRTLELVDAARVDHFRGFVSYWAVPEGARDASGGRWRRGPGRALFDAVAAELGEPPIVAENLGIVTPAVERLRHELGLPGMHVLQFAFGGGPRNPHAPENHERNGVVLTGTHDLDTAAGWWGSLGAEERRRTGLPGVEPVWELIELALASRCDLAVVPAQDVLGLGSEARTNVPGTTAGNWSFRLEPGALTGALARRLRALAAASGRYALGHAR